MEPPEANLAGATAERFAVLSRVGIALLREEDESRLLHLIAQTACELTGAAFAAFTVRPVDEEGEPLVPSEGNLFHLDAIVGVTPEQEALLGRMPLGEEGLLVPILRHGVPVRVADTFTFPHQSGDRSLSEGQDAASQAASAQGSLPQEELRSMGLPRGYPVVRSFLGVPLLDHRGQVRGGLLLGHPEPARFTQEDELLLVSLAAQATVALETARVSRLAQKRAQELQVILERISDGVVLVDPHGMIVRENGAARRVRERLKDTAEGEHAVEALLHAPARLARHGEMVEDTPVRVVEGHNETREYVVKASPLPQTSSRPLLQGQESTSPSNISGAVIVWHEVSDGMIGQPLGEGEQELVARTRQVEAILEAMTDAVFLYDRSGAIVQVNTAARRVFGLDVMPDYASSPQEERLAPYVLQDLQGQLLPREHWPLTRLLQGEVLAGEKTMEVLVRTLDGRQIQASFTGAPVRDREGRTLGAVLTVRDLSDRYRLERRLQEAERQARERASQLEAIFETMPEALFVYDREGRVVQMNVAGRQLFERILVSDYTTRPLEERFAHLAAYDEHRQPLALESLPTARILAGEVLTPAHAVEMVLRGGNGPALHLSVTGGPLRDVHGHLMGAVTISRDITERKRIERALRQQAQRLQVQSDLIERAHDAILVRDPASRITFWNRGAEKLYGWTAQEAMGKVTYTFLQTRFPESLETITSKLERAGQWEGELRHTCRDGTDVLVESYWAMVRNEAGQPVAILEISRDITQRRRLEELEQHMHAETEARRALLQLVLDELPSSVYLVRGRAARLVLANRATTAIWGATWSQDQPLSEFLRENGIRVCGIDGRPLAFEQLTTFRVLHHSGAVSQQQEIIRHPDGQTLPVLVNAVALDLSELFPSPQETDHPLAQAPLPAALVMHQDMSELFPSPQETDHPLAQAPLPAALVIHQDVTALKEAERLKDEFIAIAAHELRNPLAVLKGYVQTLLFQYKQGRGPELAEWQREALQNIDTATLSLVELTEDLLDVTRLQAGQLDLHPEPTDLVALARYVVKRLQRTTEQHRLALRTSLEHLVVPLDRGRIEQVLSNLLGNAIKYSPQGGPIEVAVWQEREMGEAVLSVRDQGIGIPAHQQARLFGRFARADNARQIAGTGLGLYICRALVDLHGGRIWFESVEGRGSTFFMALPKVLSTY